MIRKYAGTPDARFQKFRKENMGQKNSGGNIQQRIFMRNTAMKMRPLFTRFWRTAAGGRFTTAACGVRSIGGGDRFGEESRKKTHFEGGIAEGEF